MVVKIPQCQKSISGMATPTVLKTNFQGVKNQFHGDKNEFPRC